jgi:hypothetical protein
MLIMNLHIAQQVFDSIDASELADFKHDLYRVARRYAEMRVEWRLAMSGERLQMDEARTRTHEARINTFNILSREQAKRGEDNARRKTLGQDRKTLGDMAAYIVLFLALSAR